MSYDEHILDVKIHKFLARKEREHPELRESADQLFTDLISPHFSNHFHEDHQGVDQGSNKLKSGMHYAF